MLEDKSWSGHLPEAVNKKKLSGNRKILDSLFIRQCKCRHEYWLSQDDLARALGYDNFKKPAMTTEMFKLKSTREQWLTGLPETFCLSGV